MAKATSRKSSALPGHAESAPRRPSLLIVDSDAPLRMALSGYLQDCGFKVFEAASAREALAMLDKGGMAIDIVLAEAALPGAVDGFGLATWIRKNKPDVQVLLAASDASKAKRAEELCEDEPLFARPYDLKEVVRSLRTAMRRRARS